MVVLLREMGRHSLHRLHLSLKPLIFWFTVDEGYILLSFKRMAINKDHAHHFSRKNIRFLYLLLRFKWHFTYCPSTNKSLTVYMMQDLISLQCKQLTNVLNFVSKVWIIHIKSHKVCSFNLYNTVIILWKMSMKLKSLTNDNPVCWPIVQTKLIYSKLRILFLVLWISPIPT